MGTRESDSKLEMITFLGGRTAELTVTLNSGEFCDGYPKWSGQGVSGADGDTTATFSGSSSTTAKVEYGPGAGSDSIGIEIVPLVDQKLEISFEPSSKWGDIVGKINQGLKKVKASPLEAGGSVEFGWGNVDKYNEAEDLGAKILGGGKITGTIPEIDVAIDIPVGFGAYFEFEGEAAATGVEIGANATYDQSKQDEGTVTCSGSLGTTLKFKVGPEFGSDKVAELSVQAVLQSDLKAQIDTTFQAKVWSYTGTVGFSKSQVGVVATLTFFGGAFEFFNQSVPLEALDFNKTTGQKTIIDLN